MSNRARPYDLADAVSYLHYYIQRHDGRPVSASVIRGWAQAFRIQISGDILQTVQRSIGDGTVWTGLLDETVDVRRALIVILAWCPQLSRQADQCTCIFVEPANGFLV